MSSASTLSRPLARELLAREMSDGQLVPAAEALYGRLHESLSRSIGEAGYLALINRAMLNARERYAALNPVALSGPPHPWLVGLDRSVEDYGAEAATEAIVEVVAELIEILNRFVGATLAIRLIRTAWPEQIPDDKTSRLHEE